MFVDGDLLDRSRAYGLNLSKFMGNRLSIYFLSVENGYSWKWENTKCGGPDSNRRTPAETDLESVAFNLARQPPLYFREFNLTYLIFASDFKELISKTVT